jgi:hypothetical protein
MTFIYAVSAFFHSPEAGGALNKTSVNQTLDQTIDTPRSFVFFFSLPDVKGKNLSFLSNRLSQDPLENFFGARGNEVAPVTTPVWQNFKRTHRLSE